MQIIINTSSMIPIYEQITDQIKAQIRSGQCKENDPLPSVRTLAKELKISVLTVKKAYDRLEAEGFAVTVHGKGSYISVSNRELLLEEQKKEVERPDGNRRGKRAAMRYFRRGHQGNPATDFGGMNRGKTGTAAKTLQHFFSGLYPTGTAGTDYRS